MPPPARAREQNREGGEEPRVNSLGVLNRAEQAQLPAEVGAVVVAHLVRVRGMVRVRVRVRVKVRVRARARVRVRG